MKILTGSDIHTLVTTPVSRKDDYQAAFARKCKFIKKQKRKYKAPFLSNGDLFDKSLYKAPSEIIEALKIAEDNLPTCFSIIGNHDLYLRAIQHLNKSIISVLISSGKMTHIGEFTDFDDGVRVFGFDYGTGGLKHPKKDDLREVNIASLHEYVSLKENTLFGKYVAKDLLKEFPEFDFILVGDNHQTFVEELDGRVLINCGSMMRLSADQIDHKPCIWLIDTETKEYEPIYLPIEEDVFDLSHLTEKKSQEETVEAFVTYMNEGYEVSTHEEGGNPFLKNLEKYLAENTALMNPNIKQILETVTSEDVK